MPGNSRCTNGGYSVTRRIPIYCQYSATSEPRSQLNSVVALWKPLQKIATNQISTVPSFVRRSELVWE